MSRGLLLNINNSTSKGFTLIEVLISIVILSIIALITSSFLQSTIQSRDFVFSKSHETLQLNLLSSALYGDLMNAQGIPLTNFRGESGESSFIGGVNANGFSFITRGLSKKMTSPSMLRVQDLLKNKSFLRRQYYASAPSNPNDYLETLLFDDIDELNLIFSDGVNWHYSWPPNNTPNQKTFPTLVQITLNKNEQSFVWTIKPITSFKNEYK